MPGSSSSALTLCSSTLDRLRVNNSGSALPSREMPILTWLPSAPRMRPMGSSSVVGFTGTPSMETMMSPERMQDLAAGDPSNGETTMTCSSSMATSMPTPEYSPELEIFTSSYSSRSRYAEYGSSEDTMPR